MESSSKSDVNVEKASVSVQEHVDPTSATEYTTAEEARYVKIVFALTLTSLSAQTAEAHRHANAPGFRIHLLIVLLGSSEHRQPYRSR